MLKRTLATLLAAAAVLSAGAAAAAPMLLTINGDFNDDPVWSYWQVSIRYNSDLGAVSFDPGDAFNPPRATLAWDPSMGTPSPVGAVYGHVVAQDGTPWWWNPDDGPYVPPPDYHFLFTNPTSVEFTRGLTFDFFHVAGPGWSIDLGDFPWQGSEHETDYRFDTEWSRLVYEYGDWDINLNTLSPHVHGYITAERLPTIPEPGTWGLMILGFAAAGAALRRRRALELRQT